MHRMGSGEPILFVDARPDFEWENSAVKLPGAIRVPPGEVTRHLDEIAEWAPIVTYCSLSDQEYSFDVAADLKQNRRRLARPLRGGLEAWQQAGQPVVPK